MYVYYANFLLSLILCPMSVFSETTIIIIIIIISSPEPKARVSYCRPFSSVVRRPSCVVRRPSSVVRRP